MACLLPDSARFRFLPTPFAALAGPRAPLLIVGLAVLLLSPSLAGRMLLDDYVLALKAQRHSVLPGLDAEPLSLFTFTTGRPTQNLQLMDAGVLLPWWSEPRHLNAFFRPLSSLTHLLDFALWPGSPGLMHAHSIAWYVLLLLLLARVYRRLDAQSGAAAPFLFALSLLVFAVDDAHGATVGWIANRNALVAAALALPALELHHRARAEGLRGGSWLAAACFALGLCAGETALSIFGYLVAYALVLDRGGRRARVLSLVPYVLVLVAHRAIYHALGLGSFGSSAYHDPLREPVEFAVALAYNLPVLLSAALGPRLADFAFWSDPSVRPFVLGSSCLTLALLAWLARPLLQRDAQARFWTLGMLLSAIPVSASLPGERLLLCVGIGGSQLVARLIAAVVWRDDASEPSAPPPPTARLLLTSGLALGHLVVAPLALPLRAHAMDVVASFTERIDRAVPTTPEIEAQALVIVNAPFDVAVSYLQAMRAQRGVPRPAHVHWLASASSELTVTRSASRSLRVSLARGFLRRPEETHYRSDVRALGVGARVALAELDARVVEVMPDGRPKTVDFGFVHGIDSTRYHFMCYRDGSLVAWRPPELGASEHFPAQEFFEVIGLEMFR